MQNLSCINAGILTYVTSVLRGETPDPPDASPEDWHETLAVFGSHGIIPLLYWKIKRAPPHARPPDKFVDTLRRAFLSAVKKSILMEKQILEIVDVFDRSGIEYRVLKGPGLAWSVYPDPALRLSVDLDMLVPPRQLIHARNTLECIGYACMARKFEQSQWFSKDEAFHKKGCSYGLELHFDIVGWPRIRRNWDVEDFFQRSTEFSINGRSLHALHPVDALIHAVLHAFVSHPGEERLIWVYDIALLADKLTASGEWPVLQEISRQRNMLTAVEYGLKMAQSWTHFRIAEGFKGFLKQQKPTEREKCDWKIAMGSKSSMMNRLRMYWTEDTGLLEKARIISCLAFPAPEHMNEAFRPGRKYLLPFSYIRRVLHHCKITSPPGSRP